MYEDEIPIGRAKDLRGQKFGRLTVIKRAPNKGKRVTWECQCDCGNVAYVESRQLIEGKTNSCGCLTSKGEMTIANILQRNNIIHEVQKIFETCKYEDSDGRPRFDFYVNNSYLIEYDGEQHFKPIDHFGGDKQFIIQQQRDEYKNQWCRENNIPLIRIPYTKLDTLCIEDLMLETIQFRVV